jgi:RNA polymerase sigma factor (sigma-70 family)
MCFIPICYESRGYGDDLNTFKYRGHIKLHIDRWQGELNMSVPMQSVVDELPLSEPARQQLSIKDIVQRHHNALMSFLRQRLRVAENAADVAQETYIRMLQYEGSREIQSPSSLLFKIAINVANDLGRSEQVRRVNYQCRIDEMELESDRPTPERELAAEQELNNLRSVIERLPTKCRRVFLLSRVQCMTYPQIAQHCGISVKMVEKHISRALAICVAATEAKL